MRIRALAKVVSVSILSLSLATVASAQATRTWVSGVGDDVNPCSRTAPCKTWAGAISKTAPGGEIDALDPGGFGAVTITKGMTLDGGGGIVASTLNSGTTGILVNAANTDKIWIRNIMINGGNTGTNGVRVLNAKSVALDHVTIFDQGGSPGRGVSVELNSATAPATFNLGIYDCRFYNNTQSNIVVLPAAGQPVVFADIARSFIDFSTANSGVVISEGGKATVRDCEISHNFNTGVFADGTVVPGQVLVDNSNVSFNQVGINSAGTAAIRLSNTTVFGNTANGLVFGGGTIFTFGTNHIEGNAGNNGTGMTAESPSIPAAQK